eukprot:3561691-Amphidinium_carterae.1
MSIASSSDTWGLQAVEPNAIAEMPSASTFAAREWQAVEPNANAEMHTALLPAEREHSEEPPPAAVSSSSQAPQAAHHSEHHHLPALGPTTDAASACGCILDDLPPGIL